MTNMDPKTTLVIGGARSGKSRYAEKLAEPFAGRRAYIATAQAFDDEMSERIKVHQHHRGRNWQTVEEPLDLPLALERTAAQWDFVLVDCVTLWLSNLLLAERTIEPEIERLVANISDLSAKIVLVTNEVGQGIVPENALARRFRDEAGIANQRIASAVDRVVLVTAGLPMLLKGE